MRFVVKIVFRIIIVIKLKNIYRLAVFVHHSYIFITSKRYNNSGRRPTVYRFIINT